MSSVLTITGITSGVPPYNFYVCDENGNNCLFLGNTTNSYTLNSFFSTAKTLIVKVIDSNLCEFFTIVSCQLGVPKQFQDGIYFNFMDGKEFYFQ